MDVGAGVRYDMTGQHCRWASEECAYWLAQDLWKRILTCCCPRCRLRGRKNIAPEKSPRNPLGGILEISRQVVQHPPFFLDEFIDVMNDSSTETLAYGISSSMQSLQWQITNPARPIVTASAPPPPSNSSRPTIFYGVRRIVYQKHLRLMT